MRLGSLPRVVLVVAVSLLGVVLVASPTALPASAVASQDTATAERRTAAAQGLSAAPASSLVVVSHNLEKRRTALRRTLKVARAQDAPIIALQELCGWQAARLARKHPGWTVSYPAEHDHAVCGRSARRSGTTSQDGGTIGNAAIWTGGPDARATAHEFSRQRRPSDSTGMACVRWVDNVVHRACSLHLIAPTSGAQIRVRTGQAKNAADLARPWIARDELVVIAGDFNAVPERRTMRHLYAKAGRGQFHEADRRATRTGRCRCPQVTLPERGVKIDYVLYSTNHLRADARRRLDTVSTSSDHRLLVAQADVGRLSDPA